MTRNARIAAISLTLASPPLLAQDEITMDSILEVRIEPTARSNGLWCFHPQRRAREAAYERSLNEAVDPATLKAFHEELAAVPHPAGSPGDRRTIDYIASQLADMGLDVETQWIDVYLSEPVGAELEIVRRDGTPAREALPIKERPVDDYSADAELSFGWNAYSASGDVTGEVVYANYATKADFERLGALGVDCAGKIVIARYGGNYRGYKAKFAEEAGAIGLIIFNDPENVGYVRGLMYPEGGWANETQIQRGSIKTLPYAGDALTPGEPAIEGTQRLDPATLALPKIPVQPVGWVAARPILEAMRGAVVPEDWQGGLPLNYRLTGGEGLRVRLKVEQKRGLVRTANVVGSIAGERFPEQSIVIGCHHDAWTHGAGDPTAGLNIVMELARTFAERAANGQRPARTIRFAAWAAEEHGIIGSTEWVEQHAAELSAGCVAYLNLDMAAMGPNFGASASPLLRTLIADATRDVEQAGTPGASVYQVWSGRNHELTPEQQIGSLGGGSDHVGFNCHLGIPCMSMGAGGSSGVSYHSAYDNLAWYWKVVGDDYEPAAMITRVAQIACARLANADVLPLDLTAFADQFVSDLDGIEQRAASLGKDLPPARTLRGALERLRIIGERLRPTVDLAFHEHDTAERTLRSINHDLMTASRGWARASGLPERPWYRNLLIATDPDSGYSAWALPELRWYVETWPDPSNAWANLTSDYASIAEQWTNQIEVSRLNSITLAPHAPPTTAPDLPPIGRETGEPTPAPGAPQ